MDPPTNLHLLYFAAGTKMPPAAFLLHVQVVADAKDDGDEKEDVEDEVEGEVEDVAVVVVVVVVEVVVVASLLR